MMVLILPYMPKDMRENWMSSIIKSINEAVQMDDKVIAIANLCDHVDNEEFKREIIREAILALKISYGEVGNENADAISLLKQIAP